MKTTTEKPKAEGDNAAWREKLTKPERQIIADEHRERLNNELRTLASWCGSRAMLSHDPETTLTMLEKKAAELRGKVMKAGWSAIDGHSLHNKYSPAIPTPTHQPNRTENN